MVITTTAVTECPKPASLFSVLSDGALPITHAVIVPSSHRKHILATAEWGHLATDGLVTRWDCAAACRLVDLAFVRSAASTWVRELAKTHPMNGHQIVSRVEDTVVLPVPPYPLLTAQPRESWPRLMAAWTALQPWRSIPPLWAALRSITRAPQAS